MARASVDVLELLRKQAEEGDLDFLREAVAALAGAVMDAAVTAQVGADYGERSEARTHPATATEALGHPRRHDRAPDPRAPSGKVLPGAA